MKDDPAISMAFYSSIHSVILPHLTIQGDYHVEEQLSLDSIELQSKLRPIYLQYDKYNDDSMLCCDYAFITHPSSFLIVTMSTKTNSRDTFQFSCSHSEKSKRCW